MMNTDDIFRLIEMLDQGGSLFIEAPTGEAVELSDIVKQSVLIGLRLHWLVGAGYVQEVHSAIDRNAPKAKTH